MEINILNSNCVMLNNNFQIPRIGLGCFNLADTTETVYQAIKSGVRLFDTAYIYGNEEKIGEAISRAIKENIIIRKDLFIITKIWMSQYDDVEKAIKESLSKLKLEYIDLYLLHWPLRAVDSNNQIQRLPTYKLWGNMEALVNNGYTKSIGVSNFNSQLLLDILTYCEIKPAVNEIECNPYFQRKGLVEFCHKFGINVIAYNSLVLGRYAIRKDEIKDLNLLDDCLIHDLAKKYNKSNAQIALNWAISKDIIVIPKSNNIERIVDNTDSINFRLKKDDLKLFDKLDLGKRFCDDVDKTEYLGNYGSIDIFA